MKDYTTTIEEKKEFILYYQIINNELKIYTADGNNFNLPYNEHNENLILERMEKQVIDYKSFGYNKLNNMFKASVSIFVELLISYESYILYESSKYPVINITLTTGCCLIAINSFLYLIECYKELNQYQANTLFLRYDKIINKYIEEEQLNINDMNYINKAEILKLIRYAITQEKKEQISRKRKKSVKEK